MKTCVGLILIMAFPATLRGAEVIHLKNGDQLTGDWERVQDNAVFLKTETIGEVRIPLDKLKGFTSAAPAVLMLTSGEQIQGELTLLPSGDWQVATSAGARDVAAKTVVIIYPAVSFNKMGYAQKPKLWQKWTGKGALGYSLVRGDQDAKTLSVDFNATRRMPPQPELKERGRTNFFFNMVFANTESQSVRLSANSFTGGIRQDFRISDQNFWFLLGQADHSQPQSLNLRQTYGGGVGRDIVKRPTLDLQALGGLTYVDEHFVGQVIRKNAEALAGEKLDWKLTHWLSFDHTLSFYPNLTVGNVYRIDSISALTTQVTRRFSFNTTYTDHYLSDPLPGHRKNEIIVSTGLGATF